jgi:hypothetical protein
MNEAFFIIEKFAALCATPGVSEDVQKLANENISKLIKDIITPNLNKLSAAQAGIITG